MHEPEEVEPAVPPIQRRAVGQATRPRRASSWQKRFTTAELRRVAAAATLNISGIIAVVLLLLPIVGYNSTAQALPKSMLDGAVIAMLVGRRHRWRLVGLFGVVVGMFLAFVIPAIPPLLGIYAIAGALAMSVGVVLDRVSRRLAVALAASTFAIFAGAGIAVQVYFASRDGREPFLWSLVAIEIVLRAIGAPLGTIIGWNCLARLNATRTPRPIALRPASSPRRVRMDVSPAYTLVILVAATLACTVPMVSERLWLLTSIALAYAAVAIAVNQAKTVASVVIVLIWGWLFYGAASFGWHHDWHRVADFGRSLVLRFFPMATIALVMIQTVRPVAVVRLLRRARMSGAILLPLAIVLRAVPNARREILSGIARMKTECAWRGRFTPMTHPIRTTRYTIGPLVKRWGGLLAEG